MRKKLIRYIVPFLIIIITAVISSSFFQAVAIGVKNKVEATPENTIKQKNTMNEQESDTAIDKELISIVVFKADRKLLVYKNETVLRTYLINLGRKPSGPKIKSGDYRTPEGSYYICSKNAKSRYFKSLGISYPNTEDARKAFDNDRISLSEFEQIRSLNSSGKTPLWNTAMGGEIAVIGQAKKAVSGDWTSGEIALKNSDMNDLFELVEIGTEIIIHP